MDSNALNAKFSIADELSIVAKEADWPFIEINNQHASAVISLYAGQVLSFKPHNQAQDCLFLSDKAYYQESKAIKGGVPVCWPWFGADPEDLGRAAHGFVRNRMWSLLETSHLDNGETQVKLGLTDTEETYAIWPHHFDLTMTITVGESLSLSLTTRNKDDQAFNITQALHTYFSIGDIAQTQVEGLDNVKYLDKASVRDADEVIQSGPITISQEVDRIYLENSGSLKIVDTQQKRNIVITSSGSKTAVVWNPWKDIAQSMADLNDDSFQHFICVETCNAASDIVEVPEQGEFTMSVNYTLTELRIN